jgi:hypothetical protein
MCYVIITGSIDECKHARKANIDEGCVHCQAPTHSLTHSLCITLQGSLTNASTRANQTSTNGKFSHTCMSHLIVACMVPNSHNLFLSYVTSTNGKFNHTHMSLLSHSIVACLLPNTHNFIDFIRLSETLTKHPPFKRYQVCPFPLPAECSAHTHAESPLHRRIA